MLSSKKTTRTRADQNSLESSMGIRQSTRTVFSGPLQTPTKKHPLRTLCGRPTVQKTTRDFCRSIRYFCCIDQSLGLCRTTLRISQALAALWCDRIHRDPWFPRTCSTRSRCLRLYSCRSRQTCLPQLSPLRIFAIHPAQITKNSKATNLPKYSSSMHPLSEQESNSKQQMYRLFDGVSFVKNINRSFKKPVLVENTKTKYFHTRGSSQLKKTSTSMSALIILWKSRNQNGACFDETESSLYPKRFHTETLCFPTGFSQIASTKVRDIESLCILTLRKSSFTLRKLYWTRAASIDWNFVLFWEEFKKCIYFYRNKHLTMHLQQKNFFFWYV